jgi:hypothetical protein
MTDKTLSILPLLGVTKATSIGEISSLLDEQKKHLIDIEPWPAYPEYIDLPKVAFSIAHSGDCIFIKYDVTEHEVLARYKQINDPVYKDSCVEFFIIFDNDKSYYNIEFNRLGTCLGRYGSERENRTSLSIELLKKIRYDRTLNQMKDVDNTAINWTLTVAIPIEVFCYHKFSSIQHKKSRINFFKCGDDLSQPHYLAWNNIIADEPDFHLPQFFGKAEFL